MIALSPIYGLNSAIYTSPSYPCSIYASGFVKIQCVSFHDLVFISIISQGGHRYCCVSL